MSEARFSPRMIRVMAEIQGFVVEPIDLPNCWKIRKSGAAGVDFEVLHDAKAVDFHLSGTTVVFNWSDFWTALHNIANRLYAEHFRLSRDYSELQAAVLEVL